MWLVSHGVPFHVAFRVSQDYKMDNITAAALGIICQEFEGRRFNWNTMDFEDKP